MISFVLSGVVCTTRSSVTPLADWQIGGYQQFPLDKTEVCILKECTILRGHFVFWYEHVLAEKKRRTYPKERTTVRVSLKVRLDVLVVVVDNL